MRLGSLCSGAGGLDMAVEAVFGAETVWHCETNNAASKVLEFRWPGVPNYGDLTSMQGWQWRLAQEANPIDILAAGYPCQPFSSAGKKKGTHDERHLWPYINEAIRHLRPRYVVLENVSRHRAVGFDSVLGDLARSGYDAQWCSVRASDVGAPHRRERLFCLATDTGRDGLVELPQLHSVEVNRRPAGGTHGDHVDGLAVAPVRLLPTPRTTDRYGAGRHGDGGLDLRTTVAERANTVEWQQYGPAIRRWEALTRPSPPPCDPIPTKVEGNPRINPLFSEWLMGWPSGWVTDVPGISRSDQLKIIGNGVCPQQAAAALSWLLSLNISAAAA